MPKVLSQSLRKVLLQRLGSHHNHRQLLPIQRGLLDNPQRSDNGGSGLAVARRVRQAAPMRGWIFNVLNCLALKVEQRGLVEGYRSHSSHSHLWNFRGGLHRGSLHFRSRRSCLALSNLKAWRHILHRNILRETFGEAAAAFVANNQGQDRTVGNDRRPTKGRLALRFEMLKKHVKSAVVGKVRVQDKLVHSLLVFLVNVLNEATSTADHLSELLFRRFALPVRLLRQTCVPPPQASRAHTHLHILLHDKLPRQVRKIAVNRLLVVFGRLIVRQELSERVFPLVQPLLHLIGFWNYEQWISEE